jgi:NTP pyrophosphatase (non-canonical NTP hydrolase)
MKYQYKKINLFTMGTYRDFVERFRGENDMVSVIGLGEEAGEVLGEFKKMHRDDKGVMSEKRRKKIGHELGDLLFYLTLVAGQVGYSLHDIVVMNVEKLEKRSGRRTNR